MNPCDLCPLKQCDWIDESCRLSPRSVAKRPHLILNLDIVFTDPKRESVAKWQRANMGKVVAKNRRYRHRKRARIDAAMAELETRIQAYIRGERPEI